MTFEVGQQDTDKKPKLLDVDVCSPESNVELKNSRLVASQVLAFRGEGNGFGFSLRQSAFPICGPLLAAVTFISLINGGKR